ncbi:MAG: NAD(P)H-binding protein [Pseudomonadota bacterium]
MIKVLVLGASGATGRLLVSALLSRGCFVTAIVRGASSMRSDFAGASNYQEVAASISELDETALSEHLAGCHAALSCLGHNLTFKGIFGEPRDLVSGAMDKLIRVIERQNCDHKTKIILMNTSGNSNRDIPEQPPLSQRLVISLVRALLPPHGDNERAADILRQLIGQNHQAIEWIAVRPGGLVDHGEVTEYDVLPSPDRNVIFNDGSASRINVADFMARLVVEPELWSKWKGRMPVLYNSE